MVYEPRKGNVQLLHICSQPGVECRLLPRGKLCSILFPLILLRCTLPLPLLCFVGSINLLLVLGVLNLSKSYLQLCRDLLT